MVPGIKLAADDAAAIVSLTEEVPLSTPSGTLPATVLLIILLVERTPAPITPREAPLSLMMAVEVDATPMWAPLTGWYVGTAPATAVE